MIEVSVLVRDGGVVLLDLFSEGAMLKAILSSDGKAALRRDMPSGFSTKLSLLHQVHSEEVKTLHGSLTRAMYVMVRWERKFPTNRQAKDVCYVWKSLGRISA